MRKVRDYDEDYVLNQRPALLWLKILGAALFVGVTVGTVAWGCSWVKTSAEVVGPQNVKAQWQFAYDYDKSLQAIAGNWCSARQVESEAEDAVAKTQLAQQRIAHENNYRRVQAEYDARLADAFRAKLVKPADVPDQAPKLAAALDSISCTAQGPFPQG